MASCRGVTNIKSNPVSFLPSFVLLQAERRPKSAADKKAEDLLMRLDMDDQVAVIPTLLLYSRPNLTLPSTFPHSTLD